MLTDKTLLIEDFGELMTLRVFVDAIKCGVFTPDDGTGRFATRTEMFNNIDCFDFASRPKEATHVIWFNK